MRNVEDNKMLTETDSGTPMGTLFRRFWLPAMLSEEIPGPGCPLVRLRLLGENLVGLRDSNSTVGILDAYCPTVALRCFLDVTKSVVCAVSITARNLTCAAPVWTFQTCRMGPTASD